MPSRRASRTCIEHNIYYQTLRGCSRTVGLHPLCRQDYPPLFRCILLPGATLRCSRRPFTPCSVQSVVHRPYCRVTPRAGRSSHIRVARGVASRGRVWVHNPVGVQPRAFQRAAGNVELTSTRAERTARLRLGGSLALPTRAPTRARMLGLRRSPVPLHAEWKPVSFRWLRARTVTRRGPCLRRGPGGHSGRNP